MSCDECLILTKNNVLSDLKSLDSQLIESIMNDKAPKLLTTPTNVKLYPNRINPICEDILIA